MAFRSDVTNLQGSGDPLFPLTNIRDTPAGGPEDLSAFICYCRRLCANINEHINVLLKSFKISKYTRKSASLFSINCFTKSQQVIKTD